MRALRGRDAARSAPGELVAVMGPSGSGKSTLLHLAGGLDTPTAGRGRRRGHRARRPVPPGARPAAPPRGRLRLPGPQPRARADRGGERRRCRASSTACRRAGPAARRMAALEEVGIAELADRFPDDMSGGQQQRVAIARALVGDRRLVLADEPTGALDSTTGEAVMALLRGRCDAGAAGVLVTHDARHAAWADRVVFLRDGARRRRVGLPRAGPGAGVSSWSAALRIARRDARRARGRSALVLAMIALPVLGVTARRRARAHLPAQPRAAGDPRRSGAADVALTRLRAARRSSRTPRPRPAATRRGGRDPARARRSTWPPALPAGQPRPCPTATSGRAASVPGRRDARPSCASSPTTTRSPPGSTRRSTGRAPDGPGEAVLTDSARRAARRRVRGTRCELPAGRGHRRRHRRRRRPRPTLLDRRCSTPARCRPATPAAPAARRPAAGR